MEFNVGDRVRCIDDSPSVNGIQLTLDAEYNVSFADTDGTLKLFEFGDTWFAARRFVLANSDDVQPHENDL